MKNIKHLIIIPIFLISYNTFAQNYSENTKGTFIDFRDSTTYSWVKICNQIWMAENLEYKASCDCWAYKNERDNVLKYGYLYNYQKVKEVCPDSRHLSSHEEWETLTEYIYCQKGLFKITGKCHWEDMETILKKSSGWRETGNGTDDFGFSALPGGSRSSNGVFSNVELYGLRWSKKDESKYAWYRYLTFKPQLYCDFNIAKSGCSDRCLKD